MLLSSCHEDTKSIFVRFDTIDGLSAKSTVSANGLKIGLVKNVSFSSSGKVLVEIGLDNPVEIPVDSKFEIESADFFGTKEIQVELGEERKYLATGDTADSTMKPSFFEGDMIQIQTKDLFETLTGKSKQDSILIELRRLNENLEELKKKN